MDPQVQLLIVAVIGATALASLLVSLAALSQTRSLWHKITDHEKEDSKTHGALFDVLRRCNNTCHLQFKEIMSALGRIEGWIEAQDPDFSRRRAAALRAAQQNRNTIIGDEIGPVPTSVDDLARSQAPGARSQIGMLVLIAALTLPGGCATQPIPPVKSEPIALASDMPERQIEFYANTMFHLQAVRRRQSSCVAFLNEQGHPLDERVKMERELEWWREREDALVLRGLDLRLYRDPDQWSAFEDWCETHNVTLDSSFMAPELWDMFSAGYRAGRKSRTP